MTALLSPPGRGAVAVIGVFGPSAADAVAASFRPRGASPIAARPDGAILFGSWGGGPRSVAGPPPEDLVVVKRSPLSLEIHPHGGRAAAERILTDLEGWGCRRLDWHAFLLAAGSSVVEFEIRRALAGAVGPKAASILARQLRPCEGGGLLERALEEVRTLAAEGRREEAAARAGRMLAWASLGLRLTRPWRVVVVGPPNAGKSSLVNAIAGFARSIVSSEAGTTRDLVATRIVLEGWEVELVDTAGLRAAAASGTERAGIERSREAASRADLVLRVAEAAGPLGEEAGPCPGRPADGVPSIRVLTKADLAPGTPEGDAAVVVSSVTGRGIDSLVSQTLRILVPREPAGEEPVPFTPRQVAELEAAAAGGRGDVSGWSPRTAFSPPRPRRR